MRTVVINRNDSDQRIDNFLRKTFPKLTRNLIYRYLRTKRIKVNDIKVLPSYRLQHNDQLTVYINNELLSKNESTKDFLLAPTKLNIVYEDENILIVNKPVGLVVHSDESKKADTLINRIQHYLFKNGKWNYLNENSFIPSLVHRLDRNTSGLIITAKNAPSLRILSEKIKTHEIDKYYLCRVYGIIDPKKGMLSDYLTRNLDKKIVKVTQKPINSNSQQIITEYRTISHDKNTSLIEIKLITGKTHQIRAHMAFINHPLVGEQKYTTPKYSKMNVKQHQQLMAYKIVFNFKKDAGILNYLNHKIFEIKN
jgi:23S rRNA pseudouridine955/2504/2580 synthase